MIDAFDALRDELSGRYKGDDVIQRIKGFIWEEYEVSEVWAWYSQDRDEIEVSLDWYKSNLNQSTGFSIPGLTATNGDWQGFIRERLDPLLK